LKLWDPTNTIGLAHSFAGLASVATQAGDPERGARLFAMSEALLKSQAFDMALLSRIECDRGIAAALEQLGPEAFAAAWEEGRAMTIEQAIAEAREVT
jgi:hypothetical protein